MLDPSITDPASVGTVYVVLKPTVLFPADFTITSIGAQHVSFVTELEHGSVTRRSFTDAFRAGVFARCLAPAV